MNPSKDGGIPPCIFFYRCYIKKKKRGLIYFGFRGIRIVEIAGIADTILDTVVGNLGIVC